ncbi:YidH family protein [Sandaracinobacteroides hominis]|uniref:YidH family protein n=1 Tax=Sandaracinobacteroides hominis TaxID=2780086 RepID=UPI0018F65776|nr:DUF202 domain-containing protein [Sandaracinobacteroides hominis]
MTAPASRALPPRPAKYQAAADPVPDLPNVDGFTDEKASTTFSHYRTGLSHHRTELSEHRTDLSEFRTDLSQFRTDLSTDRTQMSRERTGLSIQRTRMSTERTLMSFIRTALSLISFGFTIHAAFQKLVEANVMEKSDSPRNFGLALIGIGVLLLVGGIARHVQFSLYLRKLAEMSKREGLSIEDSPYPVSVTLVSAVALLIVGVAAFLNIIA